MVVSEEETVDRGRACPAAGKHFTLISSFVSGMCRTFLVREGIHLERRELCSFKSGDRGESERPYCRMEKLSQYFVPPPKVI